MWATELDDRIPSNIWLNGDARFPGNEYEVFSRLDDLTDDFEAENKLGLGVIAAHTPVRLEEGKPVRVTFDSKIISGDAPFFIFSPNQFGNDNIYTSKIINGHQTIHFTSSQSGDFYPVFRVESDVKTRFKLTNFVIE